MEDISIRPMFTGDVSKILKIEYASYDFPWTKEEFLKSLSNTTMTCLVVVQGKKVIGYIIFQLKANLLEVLNIAVDPKCRRLGIATTLINKVKSELNTIIQDVMISVVETNLAMQLFLRSQGFKAIGMNKGVFDDYVSDDVIIFKFSRGWSRPEPGGVPQN